MSVRSGVLLSVLICALTPACRDAFSGLESKQNAMSSVNEVVVICDNNVWEGAVGDTVEYYFEAPFPIMPQPEPIFDLRHFTVADLQVAPLRKQLRTYLILANLNDTDSETTRMVISDLGEEKMRRAREDSAYFSSVGRDKWATGQLLVYCFGSGLDALASNLVKAYPAIAVRIHEHDRRLIDAATYLSKTSIQTGQRIREKFGISLKIPGDYRVAADRDNFLWLRQDFDEAINNIAIMRFPYRSAEQFELAGIIEMRNRLGFMIEGSTVGSFMRTNDEDLPVYLYQKELDNHYTIEARGIWELTQDFLGGPFVNYTINDSTEILMIDVFTHAPGKDKRNYVQRLEHIVSSLNFED
jgi:hypothetical protein